MNPTIERIAKALIALAILFVIAAHVSAADQPAPKPAPVVDDTPLIEFPNIQPKPEPKPVPPPVVDPDAVPVLAVGELYVVTQKVPFRLVAVPPGLVTLTEIDGPVKVNGVFYGDNGKRSTRNYNGYLAIVEAAEGVKSGTVYLSLSVNGKTKPDGLEQRLDIGAGPRPPPEPEPDVVTAKKLWLVSIDDAPKRTPALGLLLGDVAFWNSVKAAGNSWAILDTKNPAARPFDAAVAKVGLPALVVMDADTKKILGVVTTPTDKAGVNALVTKYSKGK